jgi:DNA-binding response OmpR family regulator
MRSSSQPVHPVTHALVLVDDDNQFAEIFAQYVTAQGHSLKYVSARQMLADMDAGSPAPADLIITEVVFTELDGLWLLVQLRERLGRPILVHSGSRRTDDAAVALRLGADAFVRKPCEPAELLERVKAVLRRTSSRTRETSSRADSRPVIVGNLRLEPARGRASVDGASIHLTKTEFGLLLALATSHGQIVRHDELAQRVWRYPNARTAPSISVHIQNLRAKLRRTSPMAPNIASVRAVGYRLIAT